MGVGSAKLIVFSPDGGLLAFSQEFPRALTLDYKEDWDNTLTIVCDATTGKELYKLKGNKKTNQVEQLVFSPDGSKLAVNIPRESVTIWDMATGAQHAVLDGAVEVRQLKFSPDGKVLLGSIVSSRVGQEKTGCTSGMPSSQGRIYGVSGAGVDWTCAAVCRRADYSHGSQYSI